MCLELRRETRRYALHLKSAHSLRDLNEPIGDNKLFRGFTFNIVCDSYEI